MDNPLLLALVGGILGGIISPLVMDWVRRRHKERTWATPRKKLLLKLLKSKKWERRSLKWLMTVTGTTEEECRTLLIDLGARGTKMDSGSEGWALISRLPLNEFDESEDMKE